MSDATNTHSASCPVCGYEHDFSSQRDMDIAWLRWTRQTIAYAKQIRKTNKR